MDLVSVVATPGNRSQIPCRSRWGFEWRLAGRRGFPPTPLYRDGLRRSDAALSSRLGHRPPRAGRLSNQWLCDPGPHDFVDKPVPDAPRRKVLSRSFSLRSRTLDAGSERIAPEIFILSIRRRS